ncbi:glycosyltransferase family 39 protein [Bacillus sp. BP-3]|uniref:glycosyltransferase family 39 protein n=1 Tax=Bacillus sp. BP-3 TaxID=3022773 RepID=UPI00232C4A05|nr:glycosyltransferase family 39 protein [Bacillus sp. BP-3]MDC2866772.1 glycosyltransferase family 39 protein [Bacillus sp. BP-3]
MLSIQWNRFNSFLAKCFVILCLFIFSFSIWNSYLTVKETLFVRTLISAPSIIIIMILLILLTYLCNTYFSKTTFIILLTLCAFITRFIWILKIPTPIESDFALMYKGAVQAAQGDYSFSSSPYYTTWVYQLGFTMYQAFVIKLFGNHIFILKLLNVLYCTGTTLCVYSITSEIFNEWTGRIAGLLYAFFIPSIMMSSVLTNEHLATFLFYLGFYLLVRLYSKYTWIFVGITLAFGDIIRPLGSFVLLAVIIYLLLHEFLGKDKKTMFTTTKKLIGILVTFFAVHYIVSSIFIATGVTKYPLSNRDPLWKFVLGLNSETTGTYSASDAEQIMSLEIGEERKAIEMKLIKERIADKEKLFTLFGDKFSSMWGDTDSAGYWSLNQLNKKELIDTSMKYEKYVYMATMLFGVIGSLSLLFTKQKNLQYTLFLLLIIGYIAVHFLIEIQTRYRYFIIPSFFIIQSYGIYVIHRYMRKKPLSF